MNTNTDPLTPNNKWLQMIDEFQEKNLELQKRLHALQTRYEALCLMIDNDGTEASHAAALNRLRDLSYTESELVANRVHVSCMHRSEQMHIASRIWLRPEGTYAFLGWWFSDISGNLTPNIKCFDTIDEAVDAVWEAIGLTPKPRDT